MAQGEAVTAGGVRVGERGGFGHGFLTGIWYFATLSRDLKRGSLRRYEILGEPVMLGRSPNGAAIALRDVCPHRAAPLSAGCFAREADGATASNAPIMAGASRPTDAAPPSPPSPTARISISPAFACARYPIGESQGMVFVWMAESCRDEAGPDAPPPVFPGVVGGGPKLG